MLEQLFPGAQHLQNPHPLVVHFPIAFLYGAALLYFLAWVARRDSLAWTALWLLTLGVVSIAAAVGTGLWSAGGVMLARSVKEHVMLPHKRFMLASATLAGLLALWALVRPPMPRGGRHLFLLGLAAMLALLAKGADYGGMMVYDYNGGGNACSQPIEYEPNGPSGM